jgi:hypothetical protein
MKIFLLDLWYDLREKRLWPVAVLLAAALVAVPLVLAKPAEDPPPVASPAGPAKAEDARAQALAIKALDEDAVPASKLDTYSAKNPFKPLVKKRSVKKVAEQLASGPSAAGSESPSGGGGSDLSLSPGSEVPSSGGGDAGPGPDAPTRPDGPGKTKTTQYEYVVDATFTANGHKRKVKRMERLEMLPNRASPLLLFLGVSPNAGNAVFLVDSTLHAAGEGTCKPSGSECGFLYIGAGSEHGFTNDEGDSYTLRIDEIRKVKVGRSAGASRNKKNKRAKGKRARAAMGRPSARRRFVPPVLADLMSTSSTRNHNSNRRRKRR